MSDSITRTRNIIIDTQYPVIIIDISILFYTAYYESASKFYLANGDTNLAQTDMMKEIRQINAPNLSTFKTLATLIVRRADRIDYATLYKNERFIELFNKVIERLIKNISTTVSPVPYKYGNTLLMKDCRRANNWRLEQYPSYKQTRNTRDIITTHLQFNGKIIEQFWEDVYPKMRNRLGIKEISLPNMEADDMAYFTKLKIQALNPTSELIIVTRDHDYLQLADNKTKIVNFEGINLNTRLNGTPSTNLAIKILTGDASDNIPPIYYGCGEKTAEQLLSKLYATATATAADGINTASDSFINDINDISNIRNVATNIMSILNFPVQSRSRGRPVTSSSRISTLESVYENLTRNIHLIQMSKIPSTFLTAFNQKYQFKAYDTALAEFEVIAQNNAPPTRQPTSTPTSASNKKRPSSANINTKRPSSHYSNADTKAKANSNPYP